MRKLQMIFLSLVMVLAFSSMAFAGNVLFTGSVDKIKQDSTGDLTVTLNNGTATRNVVVPSTSAAGKQFLAIFLTAQSNGDNLTCIYDNSNTNVVRLILD